LLQWKSNKYYIFWVCVCSLSYPAFNVHAPYYSQLWPAPLYSIFAHYLINDTIFGKKKLLNIKCVLIFCTTFVWNISHSKKNSARYYHQCTLVFMWSTRLFFSDFNKTCFLYRYLKNTQISNSMKFRPLEAELFHVDGQTDRHDEANSRLTQFCERA
jgi:surface polysaccharide O-acyltransferase-like enzyme